MPKAEKPQPERKVLTLADYIAAYKKKQQEMAKKCGLTVEMQKKAAADFAADLMACITPKETISAEAYIDTMQDPRLHAPPPPRVPSLHGSQFSSPAESLTDYNTTAIVNSILNAEAGTERELVLVNTVCAMIKGAEKGGKKDYTQLCKLVNALRAEQAAGSLKNSRRPFTPEFSLLFA